MSEGGRALRGRVALVGAADTAVGVVPGRTPMELSAEAVRKAVADAGLEPTQVDGLVTCNSMVEPYLYPAEALAEYLGLRPRYCWASPAGGAAAVTAILNGALAIAHGLAEVVVVVMADSLRSGLSREQARRIQSSTGHPRFEQPYGLPVPAYYALIARAHMAAYGTREEQFAAVAVACREHARRNPAAQMRDPITVEDVLASRLIADPLHLLDCSLVSDGGAAVVLTAAERARDLPNPPVYLLGAGEGHRYEHLSQADDLTTSAAVEAGRRAYAMAGVGPAEVDFAQLYDCFTPTVVIELEDLGFCAKGEGGPFVVERGIGPGGALPVNTHGGLLSHCHPGNPGSMFAVTETVWQLRGCAGERQVPGARVGLVHAQGGVMSSHATLILAREVP
ncbi:MAG: hypothetical protein KatS3mg124_0225 [Porticoccaceae bacterium]|nr:MAG: hypothetical protein KatS3mg124_0225 [Porticoccaceae bacterium]